MADHEFTSVISFNFCNFSLFWCYDSMTCCQIIFSSYLWAKNASNFASEKFFFLWPFCIFVEHGLLWSFVGITKCKSAMVCTCLVIWSWLAFINIHVNTQEICVYETFVSFFFCLDWLTQKYTQLYSKIDERGPLSVLLAIPWSANGSTGLFRIAYSYVALIFLLALHINWVDGEYTSHYSFDYKVCTLGKFIILKLIKPTLGFQWHVLLIQSSLRVVASLASLNELSIKWCCSTCITVYLLISTSVLILVCVWVKGMIQLYVYTL